MWHWNGMGAWGWIMMIIFWIAVAALIVWTVRSVSGQARPDPDQAMRVLDERFARGEIDQQEYEERRRVLKSNR
ncbi:MAG TPA: SHOCT domain-containing protein [Acidimicrobiia bacterium]|nr:SHOCT domain-containing protein [Acidimicrobiia bacterium]